MKLGVAVAINKNGFHPVIATMIHTQFTILRRLASGGTADIYQVREQQTGLTVALKVLKRELMNNPGLTTKFIREAELQSKIRHPNVIRVLDFKRDPESCWIVQEFFPGTTLWHLLRQPANPSGNWLKHVAFQLCEGLSAVHRSRMIHGDLKPLNILLSENSDLMDRPQVKITDFGEARMVRLKNTGTADQLSPLLESADLWAQTMEREPMTERWASPLYMSPEQCRDEPLTQASDVYSLGILFYQMFSGQLPFCNDDPEKMAAHHQFTIPPELQLKPEDAPAALRPLIARCIAKQPSERFQDADGLLEALQIVYN